MSQKRSEKQLEAGWLDLDLFNLSRRLETFAERFSDPSVDDASRIVFGLRGRVQKHMREDDRAAINATPTITAGESHD